MVLGIDFGKAETYAAVSVGGQIFPVHSSSRPSSIWNGAELWTEKEEALRYFRETAEHCFGYAVSQVRIACPVSSSEEERLAMLQAAKEAGMTGVLIEEPIAAIACFDHIYGFKAGEKVAVCDFGQGEFSAAIVEKQPDKSWKILSSRKNEESSGTEFQKSLRDELVKRLSSKNDLSAALEKPSFLAFLEQESERVMWRLSVVNETVFQVPFGYGDILECSISRTDFNMLVGSKIWKTVRMLENMAQEIGSALKQMDGVICIGGRAQIPYVQEIVERAAGKRTLRLPDPKMAICRGLIADTLGIAKETIL